MAGLNGTVTLALAPGVDLADLAGNVLIEPLPLAANETQYLLDNLAPGVTVAFVGTQLSSGAPATTVQFTFSEDVSGFGIDDLTAENGLLSGLQQVSASEYQVTFTANHGVSGNGRVTVGNASYSDLTGNAGAGGTATIAINTVNPVPVISGPVAATNAAFTATISFLEGVTGFDVGDIDAVNASLSDFQTVSGSEYTVLVTPAAEGAVTLDIAANVAADTAGNQNDAAAQYAVTYDATAPDAAITGPAGPVNGMFTATFSFTEDVFGFGSGDVTVGNGAITQFQAVSASVYSATITPTTDGQVTVDVGAGAATDLAGNTSTAAAQFAVANDPTKPSVTISGPAGPVNGSFTATFTFSEPVTGFDAGDVTLANALLSDFQSQSASAYSATITPAADGMVTLDIAADTVTDAASNTNAAANQFAVQADLTAPTVTISGPAGAFSGSFVASFTFAEDVTGFDAGDIAVTNAVLSNFQAQSASAYTATITSAADGPVTIDIAAAAATDGAGNASTAATQFSATNDLTAPTVAITGPVGPVNDVFTATITFSEDVAGFDAGDVTVANGVVSTLQSVSAATSSVTAPSPAGVMATSKTAANVATDLAGNDNVAAAQFSVTNDQTDPTVTIAGPSGAINAAFVATLTFSEDVTGFEAGDIALSNATLSNFQSVSASEYTALITPSAEGDVTLDIAAGVATDAAGNDNTAATQYAVTSDQTAPDVTISGPSGPVNSSFSVTVSFTEEMTGFESGDVTAVNATLSNLREQSTGVYTLTVSPSAEGAVTLDINAGVATDLAGNGNTVAAQFSLTNDLTAPDITISGPAGPVDGSFTATFTFSEDVSGFDAGDVSVANAILTDFQSVSASVYTATLSSSVDGVIKLNISAGSATDLAGNGNTAAAQYSVTNDPTQPGVTISGPAGPVNAAFTATFTFSEDVSGFAAGDVSVANAALSDFQATSASVYTATITPAADGLVTLDIAGDAAVDSAGNGNILAVQYAVTYDQTAPGVTITGPSGAVNGIFVTTFTFTEDITGFAADDVTIANAALSNFQQVSASVYTATITAASEGLVTLDIAAGAAADLAGNASTAAATYSVTNDPTEPGGSVYTATVTPATDGPVTLDVASAAASDAAGNDNTAAAQFAVTNDQTDVTGFEIGDISTVNASPSNFTAVSASVYTATITPDEDGDVSVDLLADVATDLAGNANKAASQYTVTYSSAPPSLTIEVSGLGAGEVAADPVGITCTGTCIEQSVSGSLITLTASAGANSSFDGWTAGPCAGTAAETCAITVFENVTVEARFESLNLQAGQVFAATLPGARSGFVGGADVTVFMSVVSRADRPAQACRIFAPEGAPASFAYWELQGTEPVGSVSPRFDLRAGETRNFLLALTPTSETVAEGYTLLPQITCDNATLTPIEGISSVHLSIEAAPPPDLLSISATPTSDGVVNVPSLGNRINIMAVSAINIGIGDGSASTDQATITTSVDSGDVSLPISLEVCETGPSGCITPRGLSTMTTIFEAGVAKTFTVFVRVDETAEVPFSPANNRVFIRFRDANDVLRSVSSAAIRSPLLQASESLSASPAGRWSLLVRQDDEDTPILRRASLFVSETGDALLDDGETVRLIDLATEALPMGGFAISHDGMSGLIAPDGRIELSDALSPNAGAFWGVRDQRDVVPADWPALAGHYSGVTITESGELHGSLDGCAVYGAPGSEGFMQVWLSLCARAGLYQATMDMPMDDSRGPVLVIAGPDAGWRLPQ
ncbi:Uncharacterized protein SCF082_LOCUS1295 [Durusdinium trenchii]|uniref:Bacterial Ig-like domain-containing protein n=1 Tax=Durusdinium trenchii TaxID=1381693 RepID=A0ABP0HDA9_9DINO